MVRGRVLFDGSDVEGAEAISDAAGRPQVELTLEAAARDRLAEVSAAHVGRRLAIVLDGVVLCAPVLRSAIADGKARTDARLGLEEALALRDAVAPAPRGRKTSAKPGRLYTPEDVVA